MDKRFLFVMSRPPVSSLCAQELLDMVLTAAAFDQSVRLLLIDRAVYLATKGQRSSEVGAKHVGPMFDALAMYDVDEIFVESESLVSQGLKPEDLRIAVKPLDRSQIGAFTATHDIVINA